MSFPPIPGTTRVAGGTTPCPVFYVFPMKKLPNVQCDGLYSCLFRTASHRLPQPLCTPVLLAQTADGCESDRGATYNNAFVPCSHVPIVDCLVSQLNATMASRSSQFTCSPGVPLRLVVVDPFAPCFASCCAGWRTPAWRGNGRGAKPCKDGGLHE